MKKRIAMLALALCMMGAIAGCKPADKSTQKEVDLTPFFDSVKEKHDMQMGLEQVNSDMLAMYYEGLEDLAPKQLFVYISALTISSQEFAFVQAKDSEQASKVADIFQSRITHQVEGGAWYPEPTEQWKNNSRIVTEGNYVALIVHPDADEIMKEFQDFLSA